VKAARIIRSLATVLVTGLFVSGLANCADEPRPVCLASPIGFAVKPIEMGRKESVAGACDSFGPASFDADPVVGLSPFYAQDSKGNPDFDKGTLGIRTEEVGTYYINATDAGLNNTASDGSVYSLGPFTSGRPDDQGFCNVPVLSKTHVVLAEVPAVPPDPTVPDDPGTPAQPAQDITLAWSNVKVYVTAADYGTQFEADLVDTRVTTTGKSCAITYRIVGLAPAVSCAALDADGNPTTDPDITLCDPLAEPYGSGLTANVNYECNTVTLYCSVVGDSVPSLK
jgi:hypothetical protein